MTDEVHRNKDRHHARYRSILEAARTVIASVGFRDTSIKAVADQAECSAGLIYSYFANRDELLKGAFEHAAQHELLVTARALEDQQTASEAVTVLVSTFVSRAMNGRQLAAALLFQAVPEIVEQSRLKFRLEYSDILVPHIVRGIDRNEIPEQNPRITAQSVNGAITNALQEPLLTGESTTTDSSAELISQLTRVCLRTIGSQPAQANPTSAPASEP